MLRLNIIEKGYSYVADKIEFWCPHCQKKDFMVQFQVKTCRSCGAELPNINILLKLAVADDDQYFEELEKC